MFFKCLMLLYEWHGCCINENPMEMSALTLINWKTLMMMIDSSVESHICNSVYGHTVSFLSGKHQ